jgi:hypothetical protein
VAFLRRAILLAALAAPASCYEPRQPPCAFSCATDGVCPSGFTCGADGVCHNDDHPGTCDIPPQIDAGDAGSEDDAADSGSADADVGS